VNGEEQSAPAQFINTVDQKIYDSILLLNSKLKGLLLEIQTKKEALMHSNDVAFAEKKQNLNTLAEEVNKALMGMDSLVNMVASDELISDQDKTEVSDSAGMSELFQLLIGGAQKITEIEAKF